MAISLRSRYATTLALSYPFRRRRRLRRLLVPLIAWLRGPPRLPDVPDYLREDVGLPAEPAPRYVLDPTIIHGWRRS